MFDGRPQNPNAPTLQAVTAVRHWSETLFSFRIERPASFRFRSGEFVMVGLEGESGKPVLRAYSMASPSWDEELEFFSIKAPDGLLTSRLQKIAPGDAVLLGKKPTGTLVLDALAPGKRLFLFSTGTGVAPFASIIRDPETYERFDEVILTQTAREPSGLDYARSLVDGIKDDPLVGDEAPAKLRFWASCTREAGYDGPTDRVTTAVESGSLFEDLGITGLDPSSDRAMICGSMDMLRDVRALLEGRGFREGANNSPADFVVEKAFVG